jgi:4'-phosphopantetheinyl transferase
MLVEVAILAVSEAPADALWALLHDGEKRRVERYRFEDDQRRSIVARGTLRALLGRRLQRDPRELQFITGAQGKPALRDGALEFNVSHSGDRIAIAVSEGGAVGVDIEEIKPRVTELSALARRYFADDEAEEVLRAPESEALRVFFSIWTAKEAVIKAIGGGLSIDLSSFSVLPLVGDARPVTHFHPWHVRALESGEGYRAAVATGGANAEIVLVRP